MLKKFYFVFVVDFLNRKMYLQVIALLKFPGVDRLTVGTLNTVAVVRRNAESPMLRQSWFCPITLNSTLADKP